MWNKKNVSAVVDIARPLRRLTRLPCFLHPGKTLVDFINSVDHIHQLDVLECGLLPASMSNGYLRKIRLHQDGDFGHYSIVQTQRIIAAGLRLSTLCLPTSDMKENDLLALPLQHLSRLTIVLDSPSIPTYFVKWLLSTFSQPAYYSDSLTINFIGARSMCLLDTPSESGDCVRALPLLASLSSGIAAIVDAVDPQIADKSILKYAIAGSSLHCSHSWEGWVVSELTIVSAAVATTPRVLDVLAILAPNLQKFTLARSGHLGHVSLYVENPVRFLMRFVGHDT